MDLKMVITGLTGQIGELEKEIKEVKKEKEIFSSPTPKNDYSQCNGRKVNEVLSPISPETLVERFYEKKQQEVKKQTK